MHKTGIFRTISFGRRVFVFFSVIFLMPLLFGACSKKDGGAKDGAQKPEDALILRLGTASPVDTVTQLFAQKFADNVNGFSQGAITVEIYPNSALGGDIELLEQLEAEDIEFVLQTTAPEVDFIPGVAIFDLPCAFPSTEALRAAVSSQEFKKTLGKAYTDFGFRLLAFADQGFRELSTNKAIRTLNDFKGQKIRTMENRFHLAFWRALGANPTPMTFAEVYMALQQGTIDGQENPYEVIVSAKLFEQQKYIINTNHVPHMLMLVTNNNFYLKLNEERRAVIDKAAEESAVYAYEQTDKRIADRVKIIKESGTEIIDISPELYRDMVNASRTVYEDIEKQLGSDDMVRALLGGN